LSWTLLSLPACELALLFELPEPDALVPSLELTFDGWLDACVPLPVLLSPLVWLLLPPLDCQWLLPPVPPPPLPFPPPSPPPPMCWSSFAVGLSWRF